MDVLERGYLRAPPPCDYTFNFWNDYLGLSTLVAPNKGHGAARGPNSITESLKATLGLEDGDPPACSCLAGPAREGDGPPPECRCRRRRCCCCSTPPISIHELRERISLLRPYAAAGDSPPPCRGGFPSGLDDHLLVAADRRRKQQGAPRGKPEPRVCVFCRNNGAPEEVFGTHVLKAADGRVLCPILRAYTCPLCSASGDNAHTIKYCPLSREPPPAAARGGGRRLKIY
ncbi:nanos homolog 1-like [Nelusetta ayraudi]|uniref:nanos homolog 1-like n=1 Tax=Nelusetta ayraudi TaxID=303726 RepID=UPI003F709CA4